jgi:hypothetical protein
MNSLVSVEAVHEFRIHTSTAAPELGRVPGAQVSIVTRSGSNRFTGSVFEYMRHDGMDANDWFANATGVPKATLRQHDFGAAAGGPIRRNSTFFFASYEGIRARQPQMLTTEVPSLSLRIAAPDAVQPVLAAFPQPNGRDFGNGFAEFSASYTDTSDLDAPSIKIDHALASGSRLFGRYQHATSRLDQRGGSGDLALNNIRSTWYRTHTATFGATLTHGSRVVQDIRANISRNEGASVLLADSFGGAVPLQPSVLPPFVSPDTALFSVFFVGSGARSSFGLNGMNVQRQFNVVDTLSIATRDHLLKFGLDYRYLFPTTGPRVYDLQYQFRANGAVSNTANIFVVGRDTLDYQFTNLSLFAQDIWQTTPRLTLTYGLRWEVNPAPSGRGERDLLTLDSVEQPLETAFAPEGTPLWRTTYTNIAPRLGASYRLRRTGSTVLRGGWGVHYDLGSGQVANITAGSPWTRVRTVVGTYPIASSDTTPPPRDLAAPNGFTVVFDRNLRLPTSFQWNLAVEHSVGSQTVSATYVGALGRHLLRQELLRTGAPRFPAGISFTTNAAESSYRALELQYRRRLSRDGRAFASYTFSRSVDNASDDSSVHIPWTHLDRARDKGYSNFDVRHVFTAAASYDFPRVGGPRTLSALLGDWGIDAVARARSGYPLTVLAGTDVLGVGLTQVARPNVVQKMPIWVPDATAGGGRALNREAFEAAPAGTQGDLPRNAIRGFGAWQVDLALRREFVVRGHWRLQLRADFYNVFNHPLFADPVTTLNSNLFGRSTRMLGRSLGSGGHGGGLSPSYQVGMPRSIQLGLKLLM